jgi:hypothetical protein
MDDKLELKQKLAVIDTRAEASKKLSEKLEHAVANANVEGDPEHDALMSTLVASKHANDSEILLLLRLALPLVDSLAAHGNLDAAENAYSRMLNTYGSLGFSTWYVPNTI